MFNSSTHANDNIGYFRHWLFLLIIGNLVLCEYQWEFASNTSFGWFWCAFATHSILWPVFFLWLRWKNCALDQVQHICIIRNVWIEFNFYFPCEAANTLNYYLSIGNFLTPRSIEQKNVLYCFRFVFDLFFLFLTNIYKLGSFTLNPICIFGLVEFCQYYAAKKLNRIQKFELKKNQQNKLSCNNK